MNINKDNYSINETRNQVEKYLLELKRQFILAKGLDIKYNDESEFFDYFRNWLLEMKIIGKKYTKYLDYLGLKYKDENTVEVGKTCFDSVVMPFNTKIISPIESLWAEEYQERVFSEDILVNSKTLSFSTYMTQNPTLGNVPGQSCISNWNQVKNNKDIIVGMYGSIDDKDVINKINELQELKDKIYRDCTFNYTTDDNSYYCVLETQKTR